MVRTDGEHFQDVAGSPTDGHEIAYLEDAEQLITAVLVSQAIPLNQTPGCRTVGAGDQFCNHRDCFPT